MAARKTSSERRPARDERPRAGAKRSSGDTGRRVAATRTAAASRSAAATRSTGATRSTAGRRSTVATRSTASSSTAARKTPRTAPRKTLSRAASASGSRREAPQARGDLAHYNAKRRFDRTPEPRGARQAGAASSTLSFVIQRHHARSLHYDFRLEWDGALKSWAIPKGPSLDPGTLRLAVQVEDHPLAYGSFEGTIPAGEYGAGEVVLWDRGTWIPRDDPARGLARGKLHFELRGEKLGGSWVLFRTGRDGRNWMLRKLDDAQARAGDADAILQRRPESVSKTAPRRTPGATRRATAGKATATPTASARDAASANGNVVAGVTVTHPERVVYAQPRTTKLDVVRYYDAIAPYLFDEVARRPVSLMRCPQGVAAARGRALAPCFFQKHLEQLPAGMSAVRSPNPAIADYVAIERPEALVALAQHGTIEFHTWGARLPKLTHPDRLILDLDPDAAIGWSALIDAALLTRTLLHELTLPALLKTTGGKGLHVVVPLKPARGWDEIRPFARALAQRLAQVAPERFTATATKTRRTGKIFVDYLRNGEGATFVAAYSLRAREGAPVAMPIDWDELQPKRDLRGDCFNFGNALARAATSAKLWATAKQRAVTITRAMMRRVGIEGSAADAATSGTTSAAANQD